MRILRRLVVLSFIILIFFAIGYVIYDEIGKRYVYLGKDAPLPEELHPKVEESKNALLKRAKEAGIHVVITTTVLSMVEQYAFYAQGSTEDGNFETFADA